MSVIKPILIASPEICAEAEVAIAASAKPATTVETARDIVLNFIFISFVITDDYPPPDLHQRG